MAVEYTQNLHLGIQTDKNDYVNWDAITDNWRKIDNAYAGMTGGSQLVNGTLAGDAIRTTRTEHGHDFEEVDNNVD